MSRPIVMEARLRPPLKRRSDPRKFRVRGAGFPQVDAAVISADADADSAGFARAAVARA